MDRNETIAAAFERLFRTYPQSDRGDAEALIRERMERAAVYFEAVDPYDLRDIETAVQNFITGNAPGVNPAFAPPAPQVAAECRRVMNLRLDSERRSKPYVALPEPTISAEEKARVGEGFKRLAASFGAASEPREVERAKRDKERGEREMRWLRDRGDLIEVPGAAYPVSQSLAAKISVGDADGDADAA